MNLIGKLVPRENRFFELFNQHASLAAEASGVLSGLLKNYQDEAQRAAGIERINDLEHNADRITHGGSSEPGLAYLAFLQARVRQLKQAKPGTAT